MKLKTLLWLQIVYFLLADGYNLANLLLTMRGASPVSSSQTMIVVSIISVVIYALFLIPGFLGKIRLYRILVGVFTLVLIYAVVNNIIGVAQAQGSAAIAARWLALGINVYGLVISSIAVLGKFKL